MSTHVDAGNIGDAWLGAYSALATTGELVNLTVTIADPLHEDVGIRRTIEARLAEESRRKRDFRAQTMHTVANTIFPIGLYRPERPGAVQRFYERVEAIEGARRHSRKTGWGTYIGRLVSYPSPDGKPTNQLAQVLDVLCAERNYKNRYEMPIIAPDRDGPVGGSGGSAVLQGGRGTAAPARGGPCLAHISLSSLHGAVSMVALYRNHTYEDRAYGNFLGLARLLSFLATESGQAVGELMVVASHADAILPRRKELLRAASSVAGETRPIELSARPLGAPMSDLAMPESTT
ncbi:hypothetical protein [Cellulomonas sp. ES6]|uniref:hypothetical protein n=1 Tax=Cellulomonas sp. ES6 TaxID=3039384 RepID=UPI0024B65DC6|nr:hypothetical protein [Cellulomonas sp. ES6]WHP18930.1 hypothetical protein P9841_07390 [Cellulomonas sp. ES6]